MIRKWFKNLFETRKPVFHSEWGPVYAGEELHKDKPCWRCNRFFPKTGPKISHICPHAKYCVMLGWRCQRCRMHSAIRMGHCIHTTFNGKACVGTCIWPEEERKIFQRASRDWFNGNNLSKRL